MKENFNNDLPQQNIDYGDFDIILSLLCRNKLFYNQKTNRFLFSKSDILSSNPLIHC